MRIRRRTLLQWLLGLPAVLSGRLALGGPLGLSGPADPYAALPAWLDTLIPGSGHLPGARQLDIHRQLLRKTESAPDHARLLQAGCRWAEQQALAEHALSFGELDEAARSVIVARAEQQERRQLPRAFFELTLHDGMDFYYADPRVWPHLGYRGPPQPTGYTGYREAPPQP